jgi:hypothetical protein
MTQAIREIGSDPRSFSRLASYNGRHEVRRRVMHCFPYLIVFACRAEETLVVAVAHVRRRPLYWLERLE